MAIPQFVTHCARVDISAARAVDLATKTRRPPRSQWPPKRKVSPSNRDSLVGPGEQRCHPNPKGQKRWHRATAPVSQESSCRASSEQRPSWRVFSIRTKSFASKRHRQKQDSDAPEWPCWRISNHRCNEKHCANGSDDGLRDAKFPKSVHVANITPGPPTHETSIVAAAMVRLLSPPTPHGLGNYPCSVNSIPLSHQPTLLQLNPMLTQPGPHRLPRPLR